MPIYRIASNPHWEMQEIYSDEGKSGTSLRHRDEFNRMMLNAADKKMDLILCASVSRFARNMSDCLEQISLLKTMHPTHPVGVYFETENIYTLDANSEQSLHIHAMLADWESANKSCRMILSYDQRILTGQYPVADLLGYRHTKDGELIIQPEEAKTVRFIFFAYIIGYGYDEIADILTEKERPTLKGRTDWNAGMVKNIMSNERRWGDLEARKTIAVVPCAEEESGTIEWARQKQDNSWCNKQITSPDFIEKLFDMMGWDRECRYKVLGRVAASSRGLILVFELEEAIMFAPKKEKYVDPVTGEEKQRQVKYYPDACSANRWRKDVMRKIMTSRYLIWQWLI